MCGVQRGQGAGSRGSCPIAEHRVRSVRRPLSQLSLDILSQFISLEAGEKRAGNSKLNLRLDFLQLLCGDFNAS